MKYRAFTVLLLVAIAMLVSACGSTHTTTRVALDEKSAVNTVLPDTLVDTTPPPLPTTDVTTHPIRVRTYSTPDTTSPTVDVTAVSLTPDELTVRTPQAEHTYRAPALNETLVVRPDSSGEVYAGVRGKQKTRIEEVTVPDTQWSLRTYIMAVGGFMIGTLALVLLIRLVG